MLLRIFLVASAFGSLVLLVLIYALLTGQACGTPAASPSTPSIRLITLITATIPTIVSK